MTGIVKAAEERSRAGAPGAAARLAVLVLLFALPVSAENNLEEKRKYEKGLEQKVEEVLANLLGPGRSRVMIRAAVDFSSKENIKIEKEEAKAGNEEPKAAGEAPPEETPAPADFGWQDINKPAGRELLPGFFENAPAPQHARQQVPRNPERAAGPASYQREIVFPQSMVKRLTVSLLLSDEIPEAEARKVRNLVSELLALDAARGDDILMMRARFAPAWYTSETLGTLVGYGIPAVAAVICLAILLLGLLKIASALRGLPAPAAAVRRGTEALPPAERAVGALPPDESPAASEERPAPAAPPPAEEDGGIVFNIRPDKLEILVKLLAKDEPADIAVVAVHLPSALRSKFFSLLPPETAAEVLASIVKVRFMDPDTLNTIKEELERKLNGAVGGYEKAVRMVESVGPKDKARILRTLAGRHPEIAARVRARVLLLEDVESLEEKDFAQVAGEVPLETWAAAASRLSEAGIKKLKASLDKKAWQTIQQALSCAGLPEEKTDAAAGRVIAAALALEAEGRIKRIPPPSPQGGINYTPQQTDGQG